MEYFENPRPEIVDFLPSIYDKVLEIGCGAGSFRGNLTETCEYWGVEPFQEAASTAQGKLFKVLTGTFEEVYDRLPDDYFDLVICNDVIEHMIDPDAFFSTIKRKMKISATIVGSIPNVRFIPNLCELLLKKDWKYKDWGILDRTHLRFFTEKSLRRIFDEHEFVIEEFQMINRYYTTNLFKQLLILIFGKDTRFGQFGFRIKPATSSR